MTPEEVKEANKRIAEFLGYKDVCSVDYGALVGVPCGGHTLTYVPDFAGDKTNVQKFMEQLANAGMQVSIHVTKQGGVPTWEVHVAPADLGEMKSVATGRSLPETLSNAVLGMIYPPGISPATDSCNSLCEEEWESLIELNDCHYVINTILKVSSVRTYITGDSEHSMFDVHVKGKATPVLIECATEAEAMRKRAYILKKIETYYNA